MIDIFHILPGTILLPILYAEIHYRFKYFFSLLSKKEPEIIADIPSRCQHGHNLPLLITIKDAHIYPVTINKIELYNNEQAFSVYSIHKEIKHPFYDMILEITTGDFSPGMNYLTAEITYTVSGKIKKCRNDNYRFTSHDPLPVYISDNPLPRLTNCLYGEPHTHTNFTADQIEFGASLKATGRIAEAMELDFFCATDHSYDLDDHPDDYLRHDPSLTKWQNFQQEVRVYNQSYHPVIIIPGEEVTLRNSRRKNVHCLILNSKKFYPGSGDGGEQWFHTKSELSITELLEQIQNDDILIFAAHPAEQPPFLQRLLIGRDQWYPQDCIHPRLNGLQFINGGTPASIEAEKQRWCSLLLQGYKLIGLAGNDAHGSFARARQIRFPFLRMREDDLHLFGKWRTGLYTKNDEKRMDQILEAMQTGNCFMTNGPALQLTASETSMGGTVNVLTSLSLEALSTPEFGTIGLVQVFYGNKTENKEHVIYQKRFTDKVLQYSETIKVSDDTPGYVRCEVQTITGCQALSNPIWIE
jgi:hypothetical protein